jgi:hypothetical protein
MRPSLLHPRGERRRPSRRQRASARAHVPARVAEPASTRVEALASFCDPAVERVRAAGGPVDEASYVCACGYLFCAAVSTTVECPQCGTGQAW